MEVCADIANQLQGWCRRNEGIEIKGAYDIGHICTEEDIQVMMLM